jgi:hypothetical protein
MSRLLDQGAVGGVAEPCSVGPYHLDTIALQESEPVGVGLVRQQDGEAYAGLVEPAVVIQLTDGHAEPSLAVGVFRFDQRVPVLYPLIAEHWPDLLGPVFLPVIAMPLAASLGGLLLAQ